MYRTFILSDACRLHKDDISISAARCTYMLTLAPDVEFGLIALSALYSTAAYCNTLFDKYDVHEPEVSVRMLKYNKLLSLVVHSFIDSFI